MKVLILTASTGGGHNAAAKTISKLLNEHNIDNEIYDILNNEKMINNHFFLVNNVPSLYEFMYKVSNNNLSSIINRFVKLYSNDLFNKIYTYLPDIIISTNALTVPMILRYKRKKWPFNIPVIQVVTDYMAHHLYILDNIVTAFITGSEYTNFKIAEKGIDINKTFDFGIPVDDKFISNNNFEIKNNIMIMLGSSGYDSNIDNILSLIENDNNNLHFDFICGTNNLLKEDLEKKFSEKIKENKLTVHGFINNVHEIMSKSDIIITKPGGLTITECINSKKPMILINPIPGQEEENIYVMQIYGIGINGVDKNLTEIINDIYSNPEKLITMNKGLEKISKNYSKEKIIDLIYDIVKNKN